MPLRLDSPGSVGAARRRVSRIFREHGLDTPELDARLLLAHALGLDHAGLAAAADRLLTPQERARLAALAERRLAHEPVARILGMKEFWGLPLQVTEAVLVPRPDTETVVEAALAAIDATGPRTRPWRFADLGTGSGALLLALARELPTSTGVGTDCDPAALQVARRNAQRIGVAERTHFVACRYGAALTGGFDLVVSNPPYVRRAEIAELAPEVRNFDPHLALDGGLDGLDGYRAIAADARRVLASGGHLVVEIGVGQAESVAAMLADAGLTLDAKALRRDLSGTARAVTARCDP
ncbi:MAG TPA: peptide chain release factor N(5)-glutamine methyltransferase [Xanthobacteraceae bacterium]|nr:peptide chain release factor N(5)-glutamine methyltransferase [Xanthobacteraceae bacterium]